MTIQSSGRTMAQKHIVIIGGGPAGLMAAEVLSASGHAVTVCDSMPSVGRKFLMAGKTGLNLTHSENYPAFVSRFGAASEWLRAALDAFGPDDVRAWADALGVKTFVGTSGRVFPEVMKASPLLRAWLARLGGQGVRILTRYRWVSMENGQPVFETPDGRCVLSCDALLLATGGASWPRLGSDAAWAGLLLQAGVAVEPMRPANCGFDVAWSALFRERYAGEPLKSVTAASGGAAVPGEFVISQHGIEGSLVYAHSANLRDRLEGDGQAFLTVDLVPGRSAERLAADFGRQAKSLSFSNRLRKGAGIAGVKLALLRELVPDVASLDAGQLAMAVKGVAIPVLRPRPIAEAISVAGGVSRDAVDGNFMLRSLPGVFVAGEMLDWEAPTGGYLLTACLATGRAAASGVEQWLQSH